MRRYAKPVLWGLVAGIFMIVILESVGWAQKTDAKTKAAAIVNGETILLEEVESFIKKRLEETGPGLMPLTATQQRQQKLEVVSALIDEALMKQFLRENGGKIEIAELDKSFQALLESLKLQKKTLAEFCKENGQTEQQVKTGIEQMLQMNKYVKDHSTESDLKKYYEANKDFFDKVTVRASHIVLRVSTTAAREEKDEARQKLAAIRKEIVEGKKEFAVAAKEYSHCPSAPKGGDIGFIYRKWQVDEAFAKAAFAQKVDEVSEIVETEFGFHIIKTTERKVGTPSKFDLCIEDVRDSYTEDLRQNLVTKLRQKAKIEILLP